MGARLQRVRDRAAHPVFAPVLLSAAWVALGAVAGLSEAALAPAGTRRPAFLSLLLAGALWVPLTLAAVTLARRLPWPGTVRAGWVGLHLAAAVAASFALNLAYYGVLAWAGSPAGVDVTRAAARAGVRWLHLNAPGFLGTVAATHLLDRWATAEVAGGAEGDAPAPGPSPAGEALLVPSGRGGVRIPLAEIDWIAADGDYARVHAGGRSYLLAERLKTLSDRLEGSRFVRVHRSAIVNVDKVRRVRHRSHGDFDAVLADGTTVRVSRGRRAALLRYFS